MTAVVAPEPACLTCLDGRAQRVVLGGMVAFVSITAFESLAVSTAMPAVAVALDGLRWYTLAFSGTAAASVVGMLWAGRWADRSGPAPAMWAGAATFLAGLLAAGLAPTMTMLLVGRALQGLGGGLTGVALYVLVARVFPATRHPKVFAAFAAAWVVPGVVGPVLAGLVVEHLGWRWVFLGVIALALPTLALLRPGLTAARGSASPGASDVDGPAAGVPRAATWLPVVRAVARAERGLGAAVLVRALVAGAFAGAEVLIPLVLTHERGLSPSVAGSVLTLHVLGWSAGSWVRGRGNRPHTHYVRVGALLVAAGTIGAAGMATTGLALGVAAAPWALAGLGMGLLYPTVSILVLELAPPGSQGQATSAGQVADALATALALGLTGQLLWSLHAVVGLPAYAVCFALSGALALVAATQAGRTRVAR